MRVVVEGAQNLRPGISVGRLRQAPGLRLGKESERQGSAKQADEQSGVG